MISSVFIILVLMIASSLCMYSLENEAQPEVFQNAFSGIWWVASTLLTVGYEDISRHSIIVLVKRKNKALIPKGNMVLYEGDRVFMYTKLHLSDANHIEI